MGSIGYSLFSEREASLGNFMCKSNSFAINLNTVWNENTKYTHCSRWIITKMIKCDITVSHIRIIYWISTTCHGRHFLNGRICKGTKFAFWGAFLFFLSENKKIFTNNAWFSKFMKKAHLVLSEHHVMLQPNYSYPCYLDIFHLICDIS